MTQSSPVSTAANFHPYDPAAAQEPFSALAELRSQCPVSRPTYEQLPSTMLFTRNQDVSAILRDREHFWSLGMALSREQADAVPPENRIHHQLNPPEHQDVRRLLLAAIAPKIVKQVGPRCAELAAGVVDDFVAKGESDLVIDWAGRLPAIVIASVLGLPESDAGEIHHWVHSMFSESVLAQEAYKRTGPGGHSAMNDWFDQYLARQIDERRRNLDHPDDGLLRMVQFRSSSGRLYSDRELRVHVHSLLVAANETTAGLMSNLIHQILLVPGLYERVKADRTLIPALMDESMRFDSPIQVTARICEKDTEVGATPIARDEVVLVSFASANRDEAVWGENAEQFVPDRFLTPGTPSHIAFGLGPHNCPGASLARLTTEIGMNAMLDRTSNIRLVPGYEYENVFYFMVRRPKTVDVTFTPEPASGDGQ